MAQRLTNSSLPQLLVWLKRGLPNSFKVHQELKAHLNGKFPDLEFFVDRWPEPEAVLCKVDQTGTQMPCKAFYENLIVGLYGTSEKAVVTFLTDSGLVDWSKNRIFCAVSDNLWPALGSVCENINLSPCYLLRGTANDIKPLPVPDGMKLSPVSEKAVEIVNSTWKFSGPDTKTYIQELVRAQPSIMLTTDAGGHVGHMIGQGTGIMGLLHVLPEFRRKGYAKVIISHLAQRFFETGEDVHVYIEVDNDVSIQLHTAVGFKIVPDMKVSWTRHLPAKDCCNNDSSKKCCA